MGFREATFEIDTFILIKALKEVSVATSLVEIITNKNLVQAQNYKFFDISHVKRQGNKPTHILAQLAKQK